MHTIQTLLMVSLPVCAGILALLEARERTLNAQAQEQLEQELKGTREMAYRLRNQLSRPRLTTEQEELLLQHLYAGEKGTVAVNFQSGDAEAEQFAKQVEMLMKRSGFEVFPGGPFLFGEETPEIKLEIGAGSSVPKYALALQEAFQLAGIHVELESIPTRNSSWVTICIGSRTTIMEAAA